MKTLLPLLFIISFSQQIGTFSSPIENNILEKKETICVVESMVMSFYDEEVKDLIKTYKVEYEYDGSGKVVEVKEFNFEEKEEKWKLVYDMEVSYNKNITEIAYNQGSGINYYVRKTYNNDHTPKIRTIS